MILLSSNKKAFIADENKQKIKVTYLLSYQNIASHK